MCGPAGLAHNQSVRALRPGLLTAGCVGVTAVAEAGTTVLAWGLQPAYKSVLFGLFTLTVVVIGALIAVRHPRHDGSLVVSVGDNGVGGAAARPSSGLAGLADRVHAMGLART